MAVRPRTSQKWFFIKMKGFVKHNPAKKADTFQ
jgi:hypothetical protein